MPVAFDHLEIIDRVAVYLREKNRCQFYIKVRAHETRLLTHLQIAPDVFLLGLEAIYLKLSELLGVVFLEVIDQLRHTAHVVLLRLLMLDELRYELLEITGLEEVFHLRCHVVDVCLQELLHQLIFGREIDVEGLLRHA